MINNNSNFKIDKTFLEENFTKDYIEIFKGSWMYQIYLFLPFQIPINDFLSFKKNDKSSFLFLFQDLEFNIQLPDEQIEDSISDSLKGKITRVDLAYITNENLLRFKDKSNANQYKKIFDELFDTLNNLIFTYQLDFNTLDIKRISVLDLLNNYSFYRVVNFKEWRNTYENIILFNHLNKIEKKSIKRNYVENMLLYSLDYLKDFNPYFSSEESLLESINNFYKGNYRETVINSQMGIEFFMSKLYIDILYLEGFDYKTAIQTTVNTPYKTLVVVKFQEKLGGTWDKKLINKPFGKYWEKTYELRNQVIHGSYYPNYKEAKTALESALEFKDYVLMLLGKKKTEYKSLNEYFNKIYRNDLKNYANRSYSKIPKLEDFDRIVIL
jgi:hypothetical protein